MQDLAVQSARAIYQCQWSRLHIFTLFTAVQDSTFLKKFSFLAMCSSQSTKFAGKRQEEFADAPQLQSIVKNAKLLSQIVQRKFWQAENISTPKKNWKCWATWHRHNLSVHIQTSQKITICQKGVESAGRHGTD